MEFISNFSQSIITLAGLIFLGYIMKEKKIFRPEDSKLFSKIVTDYTLPALIFSSLAVNKVSLSQLEQPLAMGAAEILCIVLAWGIGTLLKLGRPQKGSFILVSAFGSSAFLGYPVIKQMFQNNTVAMTDAVFTGEIGVGFFIFTLGVFIAMYFGTRKVDFKEVLNVFLNFLRSPVFISIILGIIASFLFSKKENEFISLVLSFTNTLAAANTIFVVFTIGMILKFEDMRSLLPLAFLACLLKLVVQPVLVYVPAEYFGFPVLVKEIMVIEAAMPSAALAVVFADRYGCDGSLASRLLLITLIFSVGSMIGVAGFLL